MESRGGNHLSSGERDSSARKERTLRGEKTYHPGEKEGYLLVFAKKIKKKRTSSRTFRGKKVAASLKKNGGRKRHSRREKEVSPGFRKKNRSHEKEAGS